MLKHLDLHVVGITFIPFVMVILPIVAEILPGYWPLLLVAGLPQGRVLMRAMDLRASATLMRGYVLTNELVIGLYVLIATAIISTRL